MAISNASLLQWTPRAQALLRLVTGYLFITHGTTKLLGVPHVAMFDGLQVFSLAGVAGILELVGGALLIVGLFTRCAAFILSGEMAFAYFIAHGSKGNGLVPIMYTGGRADIFSLVFLLFTPSRT